MQQVNHIAGTGNLHTGIPAVPTWPSEPRDAFGWERYGMESLGQMRDGMDKAGDGSMDNWSLDTTKRSCYICLNPLLLMGQIEGGATLLRLRLAKVTCRAYIRYPHHDWHAVHHLQQALRVCAKQTTCALRITPSSSPWIKGLSHAATPWLSRHI